MLKGLHIAFGLGAILCFGTASAAPVFFDDFDAEPGGGDGASGLSDINRTVFLENWVISDGSVDLVAQGDFGPVDCFGGVGKCVDLDGTTGNAGIMTSRDIALQAGTHRLELQLAGVSSNFANNGAPAAPNDLNITIAGLVDIDLTLNQGDPFMLVSEDFIVTNPGIINLVLSHAGGDNHGAILDNVSISAVPLPAAGWLLLTALVVIRSRVGQIE